MPVLGVNHINIRTADIATSAQFYVDVFGFKFLQEPAMMGFQRNWLLDQGGRPIIHFRILESVSDSPGPVDHLALDCQGKTEILERLKARKIHVSVFENVQPGVTRVFAKDPNGLMLELYFTDE
jgi:catechol 2,3-dioxygenase-like lactoylglutathione lyase family enzyme